jgi:catechol 2,3-dioxygenase-like lactoylglutathione lyase family enzyme
VFSHVTVGSNDIPKAKAFYDGVGKALGLERLDYKAGMSAGGRDEGAPGLRKHYHPNYYGAYLWDPDGNKVCIVCHKPT